MEHDRMKRSLGHLGIPVADYRILKLLPLIYVAWADGKMDLVKRERIHAFAAQEYDLSAAGAAILERWLTQRPAPEEDAWRGGRPPRERGRAISPVQQEPRHHEEDRRTHLQPGDQWCVPLVTRELGAGDEADVAEHGAHDRDRA